MKIVFLMLAVVVLVIAVAFFAFYQPPRGEVVELRGYITAVVANYMNKSGRAEYYFQVEQGGRVVSYELNLSNAVVRLRDPFNVYVGNPDRPVVVRGVIVDGRLVAYEIRDA